MDEIRFDGRVAVITGAAAGLGRAYALLLASRGARVVVNDLGTSWTGDGASQAPALAVVEEIRAAGGEAVASFHSVSQPDEAAAIIADARAAFGRVDVLINNAGFLRDKSFAKMEPADFDQILGVHLLGPVYTTAAAFPFMKEQGYGRVVFTTSVAGLFGNFGQANYTAAKMGLVGFMGALKPEAQRHGILVNTVAPMAQTRLAEPSGIFGAGREAILTPDKVAPLVAWLASEACPVTGRVYMGGGGLFARVAVVEGPGVIVGPAPPRPEDLATHFTELDSLAGARAFESAGEEIEAALQALGLA
ncbi:MAG: SDR family NAD(P)-dependent oxidoreductase [Deltaproteobacteria bacterium]|nr:SDR family NAD(P)-dependent oxidoreductase [Deltaproteobacteria bacterium]